MILLFFSFLWPRDTNTRYQQSKNHCCLSTTTAQAVDSRAARICMQVHDAHSEKCANFQPTRQHNNCNQNKRNRHQLGHSEGLKKTRYYRVWRGCQLATPTGWRRVRCWPTMSSAADTARCPLVPTGLIFRFLAGLLPCNLALEPGQHLRSSFEEAPAPREEC